MACLAFAKQLVDAALELTLLFLAAAQPRVEVALGFVADHGAEREADAVRLPPDHAGEVRASLARDGQVHLLGNAGRGIEFDAGAMVAEIADHAVHGRAALVDL